MSKQESLSKSNGELLDGHGWWKPMYEGDPLAAPDELVPLLNALPTGIYEHENGKTIIVCQAEEIPGRKGDWPLLPKKTT